MKTVLEIEATPKSIREALCILSTGISDKHVMMIIQNLISECDRHRPLGSNGKHGNLHTTTCGCDPEDIYYDLRLKWPDIWPQDPPMPDREGHVS